MVLVCVIAQVFVSTTKKEYRLLTFSTSRGFVRRRMSRHDFIAAADDDVEDMLCVAGPLRWGGII